MPLLETPHLYLRELTEDDVTESYLSWMNDSEVTKYLETRFEKQTKETLKAFIRNVAASHGFFFGIFLKASDKHIGNIKLGPIDSRHRFTDIALIIGERSAWGKGYGSEAIAAIKKYAFEELGVRKLTAGCYEMNVGSIKAFEKAGFVHEAVLKRHFYFEGKPIDAHLLSAWSDGSG